MEEITINTESEYTYYLDWVDSMFDKKVKLESTEGKELEKILMLIKIYEDEHYPIGKHF